MLDFLRSLFGKRRDPIDEFLDAASSTAEFVYVKIPEDLQPMARGDKYDDPLLDVLEKANAGEVTGGGSSLGDERPDGTRSIEFVGIDVDLNDLEAGLPLVRDTLVELGAPVGTEVHYTLEDDKLQDVLTDDGWVLGQERTFLHPGFGI